jgi:integrase
VSLDRLEKLLEERGNSDATINRKLTALSVMLKYAEERGWITRTPKIKKRREREGRIRWISREEELHIIQWFEHRGYQSMSDFCAVLLDSGFRSGEAMNLRWEDTIDGKLTLHPGETKNGEARFVRQTDRVVGIVDRRSKSRPVGSPRVFWDLTQDSVRHLWDKMRDGLGLADDTQFVPHCLRHTVASRLVQSGKALSFVQRFLGHKSITVTQRYAHLAPSNLEECTTVLNNYQNGLNLSRPPESSQDAGCDECATYGKICGGQKVVSA